MINPAARTFGIIDRLNRRSNLQLASSLARPHSSFSMDSPPRLFARPTTTTPPSTPMKPLRSRQRLSKRSSVKTHVNCKRCLFGRPNHGEVSLWLDREMQSLNMEQQTRWNFDFATMTPLAGGDWQWERVNPPPVVPIANQPSAKNPSSVAPVSPLAAQQAAFRLPDAPVVGATRPTSISNEEMTDVECVADLENDGDDEVFLEAFESDRPKKRTRIAADSNDENANPVYSAWSSPSSSSAAPSLPRIASPLFGRGSMGRSLSESSDSDETSALPAATTLSTTTTPTTPSSLPTILFKDPSTPVRATLRDLTSPSSSPPPPRATRGAISRKREMISASSSPSSTKSGAGVTQTRLQQYFAVKRRSSEAGGGVTMTTAAAGARSAQSRKRINFDA